MPRDYESPKLAHGAKLTKKIKTIRVADRQRALRINCDGFYVMIERHAGGGMRAEIHRVLDGKHTSAFECTSDSSIADSVPCLHASPLEDNGTCEDCGKVVQP